MNASLLMAKVSNVLDIWRRDRLDHLSRQHEKIRSFGMEVTAEMEKGGRDLIDKMASRAEPHLMEFFGDNSNKTAEDLEAIANSLSPGGVHDGGYLVSLIRYHCAQADPLLIAACYWANWAGGKFGFQFLPDPATTEPCEYYCMAEDLMDVFDYGTDCDPRRILTGHDLAFYNSLPERFYIYRGCANISAEQAGNGVCWTISRDVAEWFARRCLDETDRPVLVRAKIHKSEVRAAKASEFEIITLPARSREIKCRRHGKKWRPIMEWGTPIAHPSMAATLQKL